MSNKKNYVIVNNKSYGYSLKGIKIYFEGKKPKSLSKDGKINFGKHILEILTADYFDDFDAASMRRVVEQGLARQREPGRAQAIRDHAAQFDWDRAASSYLGLYRRLLGLAPG